MARWFYTLFFYLITPLVLLRLCYRASKAPLYRKRIAERFGLFPTPALQASLWIHAVSVGETIAAAALVKRLQQHYPHTPIVITTMTPTGSQRVQALFGDSVFHVYAPYDLPGSIKRFLHRIKPKLLIIMETELWPNTLYYCQQKSIPVVLANARLSAKSAAGYQRLPWLTKPMVNALSHVVAQHQADANRFMSLGLPAEQLEVSGSIKFDISIDNELKTQAGQLKTQWSHHGQRLIWLAASTHEGEDGIILQAFKQVLEVYPHLLLVLVPRHPERFDPVASLSQQSGLITKRRSTGDTIDCDTQVLIGDSMGELLLFYGCADMAFVGGSLVKTGGHNMLEPAVWGLPIITGESDFNFLEISRLLQEKKALCKVGDSNALAQQIKDLAYSEKKRIAVGKNALAVVDDNRGALERLVTVINNFM